MLKLITLLLTSSMTVMAGATIAPALPQIELFFHNQPQAGFWVKLMLTIPALFTALGAPFAGAIIDRFGRKPLLSGAILLYGLAGGSGYVLNTIPTLLIGRALLGLSVGAIMTTSIALIADYFQGPDRNKVMGIQAAFMGFGGVIFLILGGILADLSWRIPFLIYLTAFAIFPAVIFCLNEPQKIPKKANNVEGEEPDIVPWELIVLIYILVFITMVAFYLIPVQLPFYLIQLFQVKNTQSGIAIATSTLASAIISLNYGAIKSRFSFTSILTIIYSLMAIGYTIISLGLNYNLVLIGLIISGCGLGLLLPNMNVWLNAITPLAIRGKVLGGLTTAMFLGQFFSPILSQPLTQKVGLGSTYFWVGIGMLILAAIVTLSKLLSKKPSI